MMTELFKHQLLHELRQAGYSHARVSDDESYVIPTPEYPDLRISPQNVRYSHEASEAERELAHWTMTDIQQRTLDACRAWEQSRELPGQMGAKNFRSLSEFGGVMLAARNDGERGLHLVTWQYAYDRSGLEHGHYTTSYAVALQDYAMRAGLTQKEQVIDPANVPMLYRALQVMENNHWLTAQHEEQVAGLCEQLHRLDREVAEKAEAIQLEPVLEQSDGLEQQMQGYQGY